MKSWSRYSIEDFLSATKSKREYVSEDQINPNWRLLAWGQTQKTLLQALYDRFGVSQERFCSCVRNARAMLDRFIQTPKILLLAGWRRRALLPTANTRPQHTSWALPCGNYLYCYFFSYLSVSCTHVFLAFIYESCRSFEIFLIILRLFLSSIVKNPRYTSKIWAYLDFDKKTWIDHFLVRNDHRCSKLVRVWRQTCFVCLIKVIWRPQKFQNILICRNRSSETLRVGRAHSRWFMSSHLSRTATNMTVLERGIKLGQGGPIYHNKSLMRNAHNTVDWGLTVRLWSCIIVLYYFSYWSS